MIFGGESGFRFVLIGFSFGLGELVSRIEGREWNFLFLEFDGVRKENKRKSSFLFRRNFILVELIYFGRLEDVKEF